MENPPGTLVIILWLPVRVGAATGGALPDPRNHENTSDIMLAAAPHDCTTALMAEFMICPRPRPRRRSARRLRHARCSASTVAPSSTPTNDVNSLASWYRTPSRTISSFRTSSGVAPWVEDSGMRRPSRTSRITLRAARVCKNALEYTSEEKRLARSTRTV